MPDLSFILFIPISSIPSFLRPDLRSISSTSDGSFFTAEEEGEEEELELEDVSDWRETEETSSRDS